MDTFSDIFALVCGQHHCWAPGGESLPFCQRCTGLYVGAAVAAFLQVLLRPRPTPVFLWGHGLLLLLMVPFGYHLVPQNGLLRTLTGQLFGLGLIGYLSLLPTSLLHPWPKGGKSAGRRYAVGLFASLVVVQVAVRTGGRFTHSTIVYLGLSGLAALAFLVVVNLMLLPAAIWSIVHGNRVFGKS